MGARRNDPRRRTRYKKPLGRYLVRLAIFLGLAAGGYAAFLYVPPYWRAWSVQDALDDMAEQIYARRTPEDDWSEVRREIRERAGRRVRRILWGHVHPGDIRIRVDMDPVKRRARLTVRWHETVFVRLLDKAYRLDFRKTVLLTIQ